MQGIACMELLMGRMCACEAEHLGTYVHMCNFSCNEMDSSVSACKCIWVGVSYVHLLITFNTDVKTPLRQQM